MDALVRVNKLPSLGLEGTLPGLPAFILNGASCKACISFVVEVASARKTSLVGSSRRVMVEGMELVEGSTFRGMPKEAFVGVE